MGFFFGSGSLFGVVPGVLPSPVKFGTVQDVAVEFTGTEKELHGQYQFAEATARGTAKITAKAKFGKINLDAYNSLFFGGSIAAGQTRSALDEAGTIPAKTTFTITVVNAAKFALNLGVCYAATGVFFTLVATPAALGEYSVDPLTGIYTFYSGDASAAVKINYLYLATGGKTISIANQLQGINPVFKLILTGQFRQDDGTLTDTTLILNACTSNKLTFPTKAEDFVVSEMDINARADSGGNVGTLSHG